MRWKDMFFGPQDRRRRIPTCSRPPSFNVMAGGPQRAKNLTTHTLSPLRICTICKLLRAAPVHLTVYLQKPSAQMDLWPWSQDTVDGACQQRAGFEECSWWEADVHFSRALITFPAPRACHRIPHTQRGHELWAWWGDGLDSLELMTRSQKVEGSWGPRRDREPRKSCWAERKKIKKGDGGEWDS